MWQEQEREQEQEQEQEREQERKQEPAWEKELDRTPELVMSRYETTAINRERKETDRWREREREGESRFLCNFLSSSAPLPLFIDSFDRQQELPVQNYNLLFNSLA